MDYSATFARHFARLVSLLMHEGENVDEQKVSLRALATVSRDGPVSIVARVVDLLANDSPVPGALTGVRAVAEQMAAHSILEVRIDTGTSAADLLGLARLIGAEAKRGDGGFWATRRLASLRTTQIEFVTRESGSVGATAAASGLAVEAATDTRVAESPRVARDETTAPARITAPDVSKLTPEELFARLDAVTTAEVSTTVLDDVVTLAEHAVRAGKTPIVGELLCGVVSREAMQPEDDVKRAYALAMRRLSKAPYLRAVAMLITRKPERVQQYRDVLARAGEEGAMAVVEQIVQAQTGQDLKTLVDMLRQLNDAVAALKRMLGDSRWFVVRNAAELLGELATPSAEAALVGLLRHGDDRVRRAATKSLLRIGTPNALKGIHAAVKDSSPEVRMQATAAISTKKDGKTAGTLIKAIEEERDPDVQFAIIAALGRVATSDAVQKLAKLAEPESRFFRKRANHIRLAAVQALGEARTPAALTALRALLNDKDREVRDMVTRALAYAGR